MHIKRIIGIFLLLIGVLSFLLPDIQTIYFNWESSQEIETFQSTYSSNAINANNNYDDFYYECLAYNKSLAETKQADLVDPFSVTGIPTGLSSQDELFGYISIPAMDIELPLYIGAESSNLAKGAAILSQTSMPIGGDTNVSSNCVIAGHRGYQGIPYFREIEKLDIGDMVYITNKWETLTYQVTSIAIINPNDVESILIQEGRDMVTLLTCHPYRSGGKYRYVVYCDKVTEGAKTEGTNTNTEVINETTEEFVSSQDIIDQEKLTRLIGAVIIIICIVWLITPRKKRKYTQQQGT